MELESEEVGLGREVWMRGWLVGWMVGWLVGWLVLGSLDMEDGMGWDRVDVELWWTFLRNLL